MRQRIHAHFTDLHHQRETIEAELNALATGTGRVNDVDLLDELPELTRRLDEVPEHLQAELFAAFNIQVVWNQPMNQVTFHATITDTTPGIITELLTRTGGDPTSAETGPALTQHPAISSNAASGFTRLPICGKRRRSCNPAGQRAGQPAPGAGGPPSDRNGATVVLQRPQWRHRGPSGGRAPGLLRAGRPDRW